jgi:hypothetical protein
VTNCVTCLRRTDRVSNGLRDFWLTLYSVSTSSYDFIFTFTVLVSSTLSCVRASKGCCTARNAKRTSPFFCDHCDSVDTTCAAFPGLVQEPTCQMSSATEAASTAATAPTERRREDGQWGAVFRFLGQQEQVVGRSGRLQVPAAEQQQQQHEPQLDHELAPLVCSAASTPPRLPGRWLHQTGGHHQPVQHEQCFHLEPRLHRQLSGPASSERVRGPRSGCGHWNGGRCGRRWRWSDDGDDAGFSAAVELLPTASPELRRVLHQHGLPEPRSHRHVALSTQRSGEGEDYSSRHQTACFKATEGLQHPPPPHRAVQCC